MSKNFDYQNCTVEQLADYVQSVSPNPITQALMYYQKKGDSVMVEKIKEARKIVRRRKLLKQLEQM